MTTFENSLSFTLTLMIIPFVQGAFYGLGEITANCYIGKRWGWKWTRFHKESKQVPPMLSKEVSEMANDALIKTKEATNDIFQIVREKLTSFIQYMRH